MASAAFMETLGHLKECCETMEIEQDGEVYHTAHQFLLQWTGAKSIVRDKLVVAVAVLSVAHTATAQYCVPPRELASTFRLKVSSVNRYVKKVREMTGTRDDEYDVVKGSMDTLAQAACSHLFLQNEDPSVAEDMAEQVSALATAAFKHMKQEPKSVLAACLHDRMTHAGYAFMKKQACLLLNVSDPTLTLGLKKLRQARERHLLPWVPMAGPVIVVNPPADDDEEEEEDSMEEEEEVVEEVGEMDRDAYAYASANHGLQELTAGEFEASGSESWVEMNLDQQCATESGEEEEVEEEEEEEEAAAAADPAFLDEFDEEAFLREATELDADNCGQFSFGPLSPSQPCTVSARHELSHDRALSEVMFKPSAVYGGSEECLPLSEEGLFVVEEEDGSAAPDAFVVPVVPEPARPIFAVGLMN